MMLNSNTDIVTSGPSTSLLSIQLANCLCMFVFVVSCFFLFKPFVIAVLVQ